MNQSPLENSQYTYYLPHPPGFILVSAQRGKLLVGLLVSVVATLVIAFLFFDHTFQLYKLSYLVPSLYLTFFYLHEFTKTVFFNPSERVIITSSLGFLKRQILFDSFLGFIAKKESLAQGKVNKVYIVFNNKKKILLGECVEMDQVESLVRETKLIMGHQMEVKNGERLFYVI